MRALAPLAGLVAAGVLAACNGEDGVGYVELKVFPAFAAPLYLDSEKVETPRSGVSVLRHAAGRAKLQLLQRQGQMAVLCEFNVRKNRIVTVTVSGFDRGPRCDVKA